MTLNRGFKLFQPWATEVVRGKLNYLVRSFNTKIRDRVAVIATNKFDRVWLNTAPEKDIIKFQNKETGAIGSVTITDSIGIDPKMVEKKLKELAGKKYLEYCPGYLIPFVIKGKKLYVWILKDAKEWKKTKEIERRTGILWARIDMKDE